MTGKKEEYQPLETRHVFLDTQVYRSLGFNIKNPALLKLKEHILAHRIVLHTSDITMREVERQIRELISSQEREAVKIEKHLRRWRKQAPRSTPETAFTIDIKAVADEIMSAFADFVINECSATMHIAGGIDPMPVFEKYFARLPPFDKENSKEFPDAFVCECLGDWASKHSSKIYIVTADGPFQRAADSHPSLLSCASINDIISRASVQFSAEMQKIAENALNSSSFDYTLELAIEKHLKDTTFMYVGDLDDGEAYEGMLTSVEAVADWSIVGAGTGSFSILLSVLINVEVDVDYHDRSMAHFDREDDRWYGVEIAWAKVEDMVSVDVIAEVDCQSGEISDADFLSSEIEISGPSDF